MYTLSSFPDANTDSLSPCFFRPASRHSDTCRLLPSVLSCRALPLIHSHSPTRVFTKWSEHTLCFFRLKFTHLQPTVRLIHQFKKMDLPVSWNSIYNRKQDFSCTLDIKDLLYANIRNSNLSPQSTQTQCRGTFRNSHKKNMRTLTYRMTIYL